MIDLTPLDVRKKREDFKRSVRGYDPVQVDAFLEVVADRLEQLVRELGSVSDQLKTMQGQLETYQEREKALNEALLAAQELREEARSQSERDAAVRLREAETHAEAILLDADQAIRHSQRRLEDLRARRRQFLKSLRSVMDRFEDYLELEETRLETEPEDLGDLLERLENDLVPRGGKASRTPAASTDPARSTGADAESARPGASAPDASAPDVSASEPSALDDTGPDESGDVLSTTSRNGQAETAAAADPADEEADSGSRVATPAPITSAESEESGASTG